MADLHEVSGSEEEDPIEEKKKLEDIRNPDVVTKHKLAADIANNVARTIMADAVPGAVILDLCEKGDKLILEATSKIYNKGKVQKGIGFPTCLSVNNVVGAFSPPAGDKTVLKAGDVVKMDLGVQIDGYASLIAHTFVVNPDKTEITGKTADLLAALNTSIQCVQRLLKPGTKNTEITKILDKITKQYGVNAVEGVFSHQLSRFEIDGEKVIANAIPEVPLTGDQKTKDCEVSAHEAWALDIVLSSGKGKPQPKDDKTTTVFRRNEDEQYKLKLKAARGVLSEVSRKFPNFPFTVRSLTELSENQVRVGAHNCAQHNHLEAYPVLYEKDDEIVVHYKFTSLMLPNGTLQITGLPLDMSTVKSDIKVEDKEILDVLALPLPKKKKKRSKKKKKSKK